MDMTERDLAEWIMQDRGQTYVDKAGKDVVSTELLVELHRQYCIEKGFSGLTTDVECQIIQQCVAGAGYIDGKYVYLISNQKLDC